MELNHSSLEADVQCSLVSNQWEKKKEHIIVPPSKVHIVLRVQTAGMSVDELR